MSLFLQMGCFEFEVITFDLLPRFKGCKTTSPTSL